MIFGQPRKPIFKARRAAPRVSRVKVNVTQKNIEALNNEMEQVVRQDFVHGINTFRKRLPKKEMDAAFNAGDYHGLRQTVQNVDLRTSMGRAAKSLAKVVDKTVEHTINGLVGVHNENLSMTSSNPRLQAALNDRKEKYLLDLQRQNHEHVENSIKDAMLAGHNSTHVAASVRAKGLGLGRSMASNIAGGIGLNTQQAKAFANFKKANAGAPNYKQLERDYYNKAIDYRANMIAVTEVRNASANAQLETYKFAEETGIMQPGSQKQWVIGAEDACEKICYPMDGEKVGLHDEWELPNGDSVMVPSESHPHCRCSFMIVTDDDEDNEEYTEAVGRRYQHT